MRDAPGWLPRPREIAQHPELVVLAARAFTLELSLRALVAAYPELLDDREGDCDGPQDERLRIARRLLAIGRTEHRLLLRYREALERGQPHPPAEDNPPF